MTTHSLYPADLFQSAVRRDKLADWLTNAENVIFCLILPAAVGQALDDEEIIPSEPKWTGGRTKVPLRGQSVGIIGIFFVLDMS